MEIIKVVLTGGPCAGKTTALNSIGEYLAQNNIPFTTVPETATELILGNAKPLGEDTICKFQSLVLKKQLSKEEITEEYLREIRKPIDKGIIIYDRGLIDNKAYLSKKEDFKLLLSKKGLAEIDILDSYDLVLDLLSTASCKPEVYNLFNKARMEDVETAIKVDERTSLAWIAHRNLKIINSSISLEEETKIIIDYIKEIINGNQTKEIRKFLVDNNTSNYYVYNDNNSETLFITEYFLGYNDTLYNHVISKREYDNEASYIYTIYKEEDDKRVIIKDKKITRKEYFKLLSQYKVIDRTEKTEINFIENKQKFKLCIYEDYTILELEENKLNDKLILPSNLNIIQEITNSLTPVKKKIRKKELNNGNI